MRVERRNAARGAACAWILKSYVKNGKIVDFPGNWQRLCESVGFETLQVARAWLVKERSESQLFGAPIKTIKARKSFFRRLAEAKGSPPIDYEVVLFVRKA